MSRTSTPSRSIESTENNSLILRSETATESIKPKQIILDEDTYTEALGEIIKRDYFPSLLTLEAQHDYVDAWSTNNPDLIIRATRKLNELANSTPSRRTPTQKTPHTTTTSTPVRSTRGEWDTPLSTSDSHVFKVPAPKKYNANLPLDAFQAKYTSEDNASYPFSLISLSIYKFCNDLFTYLFYDHYYFTIILL